MIRKFWLEILLLESNWFELAFESVNSDSLSETIEKSHKNQQILTPNHNLLIKMK